MFRQIVKNELEILEVSKVVYINIYNYTLLRLYLNEFDKVYLDGIGLLVLLRLFGGRAKRMSADNTSLIPFFLKNIKKFAVIGGKEVENEHFVGKLLANKEVIYRKNGYDDLDIDLLIQRCSEYSSVDKVLVLIGLGSPKQEELISRLPRINNVTYVSVGGYISQYYVKADYFPYWINKLHLRMPYRMFKERLFSRILLYPSGVLWFILDVLKGRFK